MTSEASVVVGASFGRCILSRLNLILPDPDFLSQQERSEQNRHGRTRQFVKALRRGLGWQSSNIDIQSMPRIPMGKEVGFWMILATLGPYHRWFLRVFTFVEYLLPGLLHFWFLLRHEVIEIVA